MRVSGTGGLRLTSAVGLITLVMACGGQDPASQTSPAPTAPSELPGPELMEVEPEAAPEPLEDIPERMAALSLGALHSCALLSSGEVHCWGSQRFGVLGDASVEISPSAARDVAAPVGSLNDVRRIASGAWHQCALLGSGQVACWGHDGFGQTTGVGGIDVATPQVVQGLPEAVGIAAGERHTCARTRMREVYCWGGNDLGQLGVAGTDPVTPPQKVEGLTDVRQVVAGRMHSCARDGSGAVRCWGMNVDGQLGDGTLSSPLGHRREPALIVYAGSARWVAAGGAQTCVETTEGRWLCWGRNDSAQLGNGSGGAPDDRSLQAEAVIGGNEIRRISLGSRHSCMVTGGSVRCVGYNRNGQVGDGRRRLRRRPIEVAGLPEGVTSVAAGVHHTCALSNDSIWCWGRGRDGQLGAGDRDDSRRPASVVGSVGSAQ